VLYRWHPAFDSEIDVLYEEQRRGETVYVCLLPNDSGVVIPTWMFNAALCASMAVGAPRASLRALIEARVILTEVGFDYSRTAPERREEERADDNASTKRGAKGVAAGAAVERESHHEARHQKPSNSRESTRSTDTRSGATARKGGRR
jgi:hypothetical protein